MNMDIQRFAGTTFELTPEQIEDAITKLTSLGDQIVDILKEITGIISQVNGTQLLGSATQIIDQITGAIDSFTGNQFHNSITGFTSILQGLLEAVSSLEMDYGSMIDGWANDMKSTMSLIQDGLFNPVEKGSYSAGSYISDMSASAKVIMKEAGSMIANTGKAYSSLTGQSIVQTAVGAFNSIMNFGSTGGSAVKGLLSRIMA